MPPIFRHLHITSSFHTLHRLHYSTALSASPSPSPSASSSLSPSAPPHLNTQHQQTAPLSSYTLAPKFNLQSLATTLQTTNQRGFIILQYNSQLQRIQPQTHESGTHKNKLLFTQTGGKGAGVKKKIAQIERETVESHTSKYTMRPRITTTQNHDQNANQADEALSEQDKQPLQLTHQRQSHIHDDVTRQAAATAIIFEEGTLVTWNITSQTLLKDLLQTCRKHCYGQQYSAIETEHLEYLVKDTAEMRKDTVIIPNTSEDQVLLTQIAFSSGLARSTRLGVIESQLDSFLEGLIPITEQLAQGHRLRFSRQFVVSTMGQLLHFRGNLNLHSELTEIPDMYWSLPELETLYLQVSRSLDVSQRIAMINRKLDYANEIVEKLHQCTTETLNLKLEWMIIVLISIEVLFGIHHLWVEYNHR